MQSLRPYVSLARPGHWSKNVFCVPGIVLGWWFEGPGADPADTIRSIGVGFVAVCVTASANYVLNEIVDARSDAEHPEKINRPIPRGLARVRWACVEWIVLSLLAFSLAFLVSSTFFLTTLAFWGMGLVYNLPPIRLKDLAYVDALAEAFNNPIRLVLGWLMVGGFLIPPLSLLLAYWMLGAFFMTLKRYAEYRRIADPARAARYRMSLQSVSENGLLVVAVLYGNAFCILLGVFITKFRLELILTFPLFALFLASYLRIALQDDSPAQYPERLYREHSLTVVTTLTATACLVLLWIDLPFLYDWLAMPPPSQPIGFE